MVATLRGAETVLASTVGMAGMLPGYPVIDASHAMFPVIYLGTRPTVTINGQPVKDEWGQQRYDLLEGTYHVRVATRTMLWEVGAAHLTVVVRPGLMTLVYYRAPMPLFPGAIGFTPQRTPGLWFLLIAAPVTWVLLFLAFISPGFAL